MKRRRKMPLSFLKDHRRSPGDHIFSPAWTLSFGFIWGI
jgi:hypothetical protein